MGRGKTTPPSGRAWQCAEKISMSDGLLDRATNVSLLCSAVSPLAEAVAINPRTGEMKDKQKEKRTKWLTSMTPKVINDFNVVEVKK